MGIEALNAAAKRKRQLRPHDPEEAAALAEAHFGWGLDDEPAAKKQKQNADAFTFTQEVLDKAPDNVQTVRSLLQFLEKKLQAEVPAAPEVGGPEALRSRLQAHADKVGRLSQLRATS